MLPIADLAKKLCRNTDPTILPNYGNLKQIASTLVLFWHDSCFKVKDRVCFASVFITYNKLYVRIFCKTSVTLVLYHYQIVINNNIMIIAVMYTAKSQHSFVDSQRRDDTYGLRSLACIQSQSCTTGDLEYLHGNNRRLC